MTHKLLSLVLALLVGFSVAVVPAAAEEIQMYDGEPTDPEGVLLILSEQELDLEDHGMAGPPAQDDDEYASWYEALIELLRSLGLLPQEGRTL